jgi:hypothetical protein
MQQAHQMVLWEVQQEIERLQDELAILLEKQAEHRARLLAEIDFVWMVEN